ncbi:TetR/AcrR family transcriptional regulator [Sphingomonas crocodyli]|nr:TetR/AcrR family transcriptional regulator [Sphingomonas crocodyli]
MTKRMADGGRAQVVATARKLFQERGFHQTAMAELSERAGISVGQIYRLFANKSEMIAAIIEDDTEAQIASMAEIRSAVAEGRMSAQEGFRTIAFDTLTAGEEALTFEILAEGFRNPAIGEGIGVFCDRYRAKLRDLIVSTNANITGDRLAAAEEMLLAILFGLGNRSLSKPQLSAEDTANYAAAMIVGMLTASCAKAD